MKIKALFLAGSLLFSCCGRSSRPALVPEINPPLIQEDVFVGSGRLAGDILFPCGAGIGWVDADGKIVTWDAEKKTAGEVVALPFPVSDPPFRQDDCLVLRDAAADRLLVFDLVELKAKFELHDLQAKQILGADRDCLVYLDAAGLVVYSWRRPAGIFRLPAPEKVFFNCHFYSDRIVILSRERLITFWRKNGEFRQAPLPDPAASASYCDGRHVYYGSSQRQLVKFSLSQKRVLWKMKLGQVLERRPFAFAGSIVANPADNNVLQVNGRGSVRWWLALQSTLRFDLVPMNDYLAAMLLNREIKFIDPVRKLVTVFKSSGNPISRPLAFGRDLYFMLQEGPTVKLQRVGNHYGIDVKLDPDKVQWMGQSIRFSIHSRNLLKPVFDLLICDREGKTVLRKNAEKTEPLQLVWIPDRAGNFTFKVTASGLNRKAEAEVSFQVMDPRKMVPEFYLHF